MSDTTPVPPNIVNRTMFTRYPEKDQDGNDLSRPEGASPKGGDNLAVLRGINTDSVDLIYLDPPFNSKKDWNAPIGSKAAGAAFKDSWNLSDVDLQWHEQLRAQNRALHDVILAAQGAGGNSTMSYLLMMAPRLLELQRVLKPSGSIYLHCDPTESHALKLVLDTIFGRDCFRNEIIWKRTAGGKSDAKKWGAAHDVLFYYAGDGHTWNTQYLPQDPDYIARAYRNEDDRGRWQADQLLASGASYGESGMPWRGIDPGAVSNGKHWSTPTRGGMSEFLKDYISGWPDDYPTVHERLDALDAHGFIYWPPRGAMPRLKRYLASTKGQPARDVFTDIGPLQAQAKEKVGYPTQKPLALLRRIIEASSNPGDVVLDPFCGCATACIAAEELGRQWIGIDLSPRAIDLVKLRLADQLNLPQLEVKHRVDLPRRTDQGNLPRPRYWKDCLYGKQGGFCGGCREHFQPRHLEVDHIVPKADGGTDHRSNLQLLCGNCNRRKGAGSMAEFMVKLLDERR